MLWIVRGTEICEHELNCQIPLIIIYLLSLSVPLKGITTNVIKQYLYCFVQR